MKTKLGQKKNENKRLIYTMAEYELGLDWNDCVFKVSHLCLINDIIISKQSIVVYHHFFNVTPNEMIYQIHHITFHPFSPY